MLDLQDKYPKQGMKKPSLSEMVSIASPKWNALTPQEKDKYNRKAKESKGNKDAFEGKYTSDGIPIVQLQKEILEQEQEKEDMKLFVQDKIEQLGSIGNIAEADFYIMGFNILCATDDGTYLPNEVGIVKYSLNHGIQDIFHKFINPGPIPVGYTSDAKAHSETTHQIPIIGFEEGDLNYAGIYHDIKRFTRAKNGDNGLIFCFREQLEQNDGCLQWLHCKSYSQEKQQLFLADITYLLIELAAVVNQPYSSEALAEDVLIQHHFDYCSNTMCKFHEDRDNPHCALAYSQRLCFLLSDALCQKYDIAVTERHMPERLDKPVHVEIWQPKGPLMPVINKVNVPLKPVREHVPTTLQHHSRSMFVDHDDTVIVPSMMNSPRTLPTETPREPPDVDDEVAFPKLNRPVRELNLQEATTSEFVPLRQPRELPDLGAGRGNVWNQNLGRGSLHLGLGIGRGIRKKQS